jgi:outer membrane protein OmpA-like peptidoglycan-associated protein/opacity protein-like surface antigen
MALRKANQTDYRGSIMQKTILAFAILFLCVPALPAYALDEEGGYFGIRAGLAKNDHSCEAEALECDRDGTGYGIFGGYNFNRRFGIELGYTNVADSTAVYPEIRLQGEVTAIDLSAKYSRDFLGKSRAFVKLGATYWQGEVKGWGTKVDGSGFSPALGIGVALPFSDRFSARLEYQYFGKVGDSELGHTQPTLLSLGISWQFSSPEKLSSTVASPSYASSPTDKVSPSAVPEVDSSEAHTGGAEVAATSAPPASVNTPEESSEQNTFAATGMTGDIQQTDGEISEVDSDAPEADRGISELNRDISELNSGISELDSDISELDGGIVELNNDSSEEELAAVSREITVAEETAGPIVIDDHSSNALFSKGSAVLKINYALEKIAVDLLRRPHLFVHIAVHTDDQGTAEQNRQLSIARANKLADYLKWQGVSGERITVEGKGESHPIADDNIEVGRARSRRAEFFISETRTQR